MLADDAIRRGQNALKGYRQWADDLNGGTTTNEDRMAQALEDLIVEVTRFKSAMDVVRVSAQAASGDRQTQCPETAIAEILKVSEDALRG